MNPALVPYPPAIRRAALVIALLLAAGIAWLSLIPGGTVPAPHLSDKVRHFGAYATLAIPVAMWFGPGRLVAVLVLTLYGAGLEVAQGLLSETREASFFDAVANALGASTGALLVWIIARTRAKRDLTDSDR
ncbi:MAG: VanZ family protein [Hyphomonas sp.]|nr:VanZ family protein [Hyphomonas sp.]